MSLGKYSGVKERHYRDEIYRFNRLIRRHARTLERQKVQLLTTDDKDAVRRRISKTIKDMVFKEERVRELKNKLKGKFGRGF